MKTIFVAAAVIGIIGITTFLYWYNYNEVKEAMSSMVPEFMLMVYGQEQQEEDNPALKALQMARQEMNLRRNASNLDAPEPRLFNSISEGDIPPIPMENQIMIEIRASERGTAELGWRGNVAYQDGRNVISFDGVYEDYILVNCFAYEKYAMSFQKTDAEGSLWVQIWYRDAGYDRPTGGQKILDDARTEAAYGIVQLSGTCKDPTVDNPLR